MQPNSSPPSNPSVTVTASGRLHLALLEMSGELGRMDMGIGLAMAQPEWSITGSPSPTIAVRWASEMPDRSGEIRPLVARLSEHLGLTGAAVTVSGGIPAHVGLGSTTQLFMGIGRVLAKLAGRELGSLELGRLVGRGGTSGIGVHRAASSGLIVDAGHRLGVDKTHFGPSHDSETVRPPARICALPFPGEEALYVIPRLEGVQGARETSLFATYCPIDDDEVDRSVRIAFSLVIAGTAEGCLESVCRGVEMLQDVGFKRLEIASYGQMVTDLLAELRALGGQGVGMSSFGPGIYVLAGDWPRIISWCQTQPDRILSAEVLRVCARQSE